MTDSTDYCGACGYPIDDAERCDCSSGVPTRGSAVTRDWWDAQFELGMSDARGDHPDANVSDLEHAVIESVTHTWGARPIH